MYIYIYININIQGPSDPAVGLLRAPVPHAMAASRKAVRQFAAAWAAAGAQQPNLQLGFHAGGQCIYIYIYIQGPSDPAVGLLRAPVPHAMAA